MTELSDDTSRTLCGRFRQGTINREFFPIASMSFQRCYAASPKFLKLVFETRIHRTALALPRAAQPLKLKRSGAPQSRALERQIRAIVREQMAAIDREKFSLRCVGTNLRSISLITIAKCAISTAEYLTRNRKNLMAAKLRLEYQRQTIYDRPNCCNLEYRKRSRDYQSFFRTARHRVGIGFASPLKTGERTNASRCGNHARRARTQQA